MGAGVLDAGAAGHDLATEASDILDVDVVRLACEADKRRSATVRRQLLLDLG